MSKDGKLVSIEKLEGPTTCSGPARRLERDSPCIIEPPERPASKPGEGENDDGAAIDEPIDPPLIPIGADKVSTLMVRILN